YLLVPTLTLTMASVCLAGGPFTGTTTGTFGVANKTGTFIDWRTFPFFFNDNNAADAVAVGENSDFLRWGNPVAPSGRSSVEFFPAVGGFGPVAANTAFQIGKITYVNGTI